LTDQSTPASASPRYSARGVSAEKQDVHRVVDRLDQGLFPGSFCKVTEDVLAGSDAHCNIIHADGSGTKSVLAYLQYKETGSPEVFKGIAQDSIVMNLDDLICVGATQDILISNTINRNAKNCPGEVVQALIEGSETFIATMRDLGVNLIPGGGETADVGDLTGTLTVDSNAVVRLPRAQVVTNSIQAGHVIVGLASFGQCRYEQTLNSGIASNGLTSARHELLSSYYAEAYPESYDHSMPKDLAYCGPYRLDDLLPGGTGETVGGALLSPTRTYAPFVRDLLKDMGTVISGLIHCSGGAQTKCLKFGHDLHFIKDNLFPVPPIFEAIKNASKSSTHEMYQVFNMGHRLEVYLPSSEAPSVVALAQEHGIDARGIGYTEAHDHNKLSLRTSVGETIFYP